jgi:hypothetical protein
MKALIYNSSHPFKGQDVLKILLPSLLCIKAIFLKKNPWFSNVIGRMIKSEYVIYCHEVDTRSMYFGNLVFEKPWVFGS